ncbi:cytochrome P450 93B2-like isoform X1 [Malania oleifera]|uniref:cytochrome P450 93B2-like isoform X1 n=1 Tax=Malania oleifera TaxID=397392 RepID=UPI0025ADE391|nr:cytochrome P450 93B2-like isoform X1 [Malania oleifera]
MILQLLCYATLFLLSFLLLRATLSSLAHRHLRLPPGPLALPVIGHFHLLGPLLHRSFHHLSSRYGPLIFLRLGSVPAVIAASPELAKELLKTNELTFVSRHQSAAIDYLMYDAAFAFAPYGPYWKLVKKLSMTKLIGAQPLSRFAHLRAAELRHLIRWVAKKAEAGERVNVTQELLKLTNNVISQMMLSMRCSEAEGKADAARRVAREVTQIFGELNVSDFIWVCRRWDVQGFRKRFTDIRRRYDALIEEIITEREGVRKKLKRIGDGGGEEGVKDFLDILLDIIEDENSEMKISRVHIKALILVSIYILTYLICRELKVSIYYLDYLIIIFFFFGLRTEFPRVRFAVYVTNLALLKADPTTPKEGFLHGGYRHISHSRRVDTVGAHQPPGRARESARGDRPGHRKDPPRRRIRQPESPIHPGHHEGELQAPPSRPAHRQKIPARFHHCRLHYPGEHHALRQHLVHRKGPQLLGQPVGIPAGAVLGAGHGGKRVQVGSKRGREGAAFPAFAFRVGSEGLPRSSAGHAGASGGAGGSDPVLRLEGRRVGRGENERW